MSFVVAEEDVEDKSFGVAEEDAEGESFGVVEEEALTAGCLDWDVGRDVWLGDLLACCLLGSLFFVSCFAILAVHVEVLFASLFCFSRTIISRINRNLSSMSLFSSSNS